MKKAVVYTNLNGGVSLCIPTGELSIEEVQKKDIPANVESFIIDASAIPEADDDFFDAWEQENGVISINFEKSKEVAKRRLRFARKPLLQEQDIAFQRALELGEDTSAIVAEKQRLRDITKLADQATTLDQLRSIKL